MALLRPRVWLAYGAPLDETVSVSGPLSRWYGPTLSQESERATAMRATVAMGAGPAPLGLGGLDYSPPEAQPYPVRMPQLMPQPLSPMRGQASR